MCVCERVIEIMRFKYIYIYIIRVLHIIPITISTYGCLAKRRTIPSSYRAPDVLRRVRRDSYCKSTTPYYGEGRGVEVG